MGDFLPGYDFTGLLATSATGAVYIAHQRSLDRQVAIRVVAPDVSGIPGFRERVQLAARTMGKLNHPNLISVFDHGAVANMLYVVMEFVPGKSLAHSARGQRIDPTQAIALIRSIAMGLDHAHSNGVVHGDLHPSCILLNQQAEPKIGGFGMDAPADHERHEVFTAPELAATPDRPTEVADIYSLGAIFYQLLTGLPHSSSAQPPSRLSGCNPGIDLIWLQATHPQPGQRYRNVRGFLHALDRLESTTPATTGTNRPKVAANPNPAAARPGRPPTLATTEVGANWKLIRHIFIIAFLLFAIWQAWQWRNRVIENRRHYAELTRNEIANQEARMREKARKRAEEAARARTQSPAPNEPRIPDHSLTGLAASLAAGNRDVMPDGSVRQGSGDYFLVTHPMSWPDAAWFAEQHGGHLAVPNAEADLKWIVSEVAQGKAIWLGAARSGQTTWTLATGAPWKPSREPNGSGSYLAVSANGELEAADAETTRAFVIQWNRDGSNPGKLANQLEITRKSLADGKSNYPPGTVFLNNRHYLFVPRTITWSEAHDLAELSGGHLAVASQPAEIQDLTDLTMGYVAPQGIWIGACRKSDEWQWITNEPWTAAQWIDESAAGLPDSAAVIIPGRGWDSSPQSGTASGLLIEWSKDQTSTTAAGGNDETKPKSTTQATALTARARQLILAADQERMKQLKANSSKFSWDLDIFYRNLPTSGQQFYGPQINTLKELIENDRVPSDFTNVRLSPELAKICSDFLRSEQRIDAEFQTTAGRIHKTFVAKMTELESDARKSGQIVLADSLREIVREATSLGGWLETFGVKLRPEPS